MKYMITGYGGQLGYDLKNQLLQRGVLEQDILALTRTDLDITNQEAVYQMVHDFYPDVIFHCAAFTAVDKAEINKEEAYASNVIGTKNLTEASIQVNASIVYVSTDYVFDGTKDGIYVEEDIPHPLNVYGKTKYLGEEEARKNPKHFITRVSWVFGIHGNNFVKKMLQLAETHNQLNIVADQVGSPTYTVDLANLLIDMVQTDRYGTYHVTNDGFCSWADLAKYVFESNEKQVHVNYVTTEEYLALTGAQQANRPKNSRLSKEKLVEQGFSMLPDWKDAVDRYSKELVKVKK